MSGTLGGSENMEAAGKGNPTVSAQLLNLADFDRGNPFRVLSELRDYWDGLRNGRAIPSRLDINPREIHRSLDYAFVLERIAPGAARFRLAGQHLIDLMGMEVRGMPLCSVINPSSRGRLSDVLESVFKAPQIAELTLSSKGEYARPELTAKILLLPLKSDLGDVTRAFGCMVTRGDIGVAPRRFTLEDEQISPIFEGGAVLDPSPSSLSTKPKPRFRSTAKAAAKKAEPAREPAKITPAKKPRMTIVETPEQRRATFRVITDNSG